MNLVGVLQRGEYNIKLLALQLNRSSSIIIHRAACTAVDHVTNFHRRSFFFHPSVRQQSRFSASPDLHHVNIESKKSFVRTKNDTQGVTTAANYYYIVELLPPLKCASPACTSSCHSNTSRMWVCLLWINNNYKIFIKELRRMTGRTAGDEERIFRCCGWLWSIRITTRPARKALIGHCAIILLLLYVTPLPVTMVYTDFAAVEYEWYG